MKLIGIGDVHTRDIWKDIIEKHDTAEHIVFFGDYVDPYYEIDEYPSGIQVIQTLNDIIQFKKENMDKVTLLIGNHDAHYIWLGEIQKCSRFNNFIANKLNMIYNHDIELFQIAYQIDNHLFTHAGVSTKWVYEHDEYLIQNGLNDVMNIGEVLNRINETPEGRSRLNQVGYFRGGNSGVGGPLWADLEDTDESYLPDMHQYVGHSKVRYIDKQERVGHTGSITYCDTLHKRDFSMTYDVLNINI